MWRMLVCAALGAAGCVSSGTWSTFSEVERELDGADSATSTSGGAQSRAAPADCIGLASAIAENYPTLRAARQRARAALARGRSRSAQPAPRLMLELWDFPIGDPQMADREGMYMVGIEQDILAHDVLEARARAGAAEARMELGEVSDMRRMVRMRAAQLCADWTASELEAERIVVSEGLTERMREAMLAQLRTGGMDGGGSLGDLARVEGELARMRRMRVEVEARRDRAAAQINELLERTGRESLTAPPPISAIPVIAQIDRLLTGALERRGELVAARARVRAAEAMADEAEAMAAWPMFMLSASYMQQPSMRPGIGASIGMTLPWLWSGEGAARDAALADAEAAREQLEALEIEVRTDVRASLIELQGMERALAQLRESERPAAQRALEAIVARYSTGQIDLNAWLDAVRMLREVDVEEARLLGAIARAFAELESAVGEPIATETTDE